MVRLALHVFLRSGREALVRLLITTAAVGVGVALLLSVFAIYHGYQATTDRACWTCTGRPDPASLVGPAEPGPVSTAPVANGELWNHTEDFYQGRVIERADVAALGPDAPVVPGLSRVPHAGEYYVSPALAALIAAVPRDELGDRFPGTQVGLIGPAGLSGPDDLSIVIGRPAADLAAVPNTVATTTIQNAPAALGSTNLYRFGFALGAVALLLPMLILIGNATRLAAARRAERYAAMRLVGATPRQVSIIASVDAVVGALAGSASGIGIFLLLQPYEARISITGSRFYENYVTPTAAGYWAVLIGVPVAAAVASLLSLRRVRISPLGVSRRATPPPPRGWRVIPLGLGLVVFLVPLLVGDPKNPDPGLAALGLILIMAGLVIGGTWLTMRGARVLARFVSGPSSLLAARRMADNPQSAFRSVSGLVLAVFVGTLLAGVVPTALAAQQTTTDAALTNVLRFMIGAPADGRSNQAGTTLVSQLAAQPGVHVLPLYHNPRDADRTGFGNRPPSVVSCASLAQFPEFGRCAPGATAVEAVSDADAAMFTDNLAVLNKALPLVTPESPASSYDVAALQPQTVLIKVDSAARLEQVRTFLAVTYPNLNTGGNGFAPQTFGEVAEVRAALYLEIGNVVLLVVAVTLIVAGCSLAIAMGGGIVERRRPFTLLRVSGTTTGVLRRVVLLESVLPLVTATVIAALTGLAVAIPVGNALTPVGTPGFVQLPGATYYLTMGTAMLVSLAVIVATLPLLNRITVPDNARFE